MIVRDMLIQYEPRVLKNALGTFPHFAEALSVLTHECSKSLNTDGLRALRNYTCRITMLCNGRKVGWMSHDDLVSFAKRAGVLAPGGMIFYSDVLEHNVVLDFLEKCRGTCAVAT